jgi:hypothetical protein
MTNCDVFAKEYHGPKTVKRNPVLSVTVNGAGWTFRAVPAAVAPLARAGSHCLETPRNSCALPSAPGTASSPKAAP